MLFCHSQPETFTQPPSGCIRDALAPFLKQEEALVRQKMVLKTTFKYVLRAATSPAVKQQEETLTYLNQGQSYEIVLQRKRQADDTEPSSKLVKSVVRVVFHDRRLQYMEHQQLEGWRWNRPGDRILDFDVPMSVGVVESYSHPMHLNTIEFLWDPVQGASVYIQVNCISTEFTLKKHGGEKGAPFRIQVDTFGTGPLGGYTEPVHSSSCQVKVFKPKGADRKLKTDKEKMDKKLPHDRDKYQQSHDTTELRECSPWPDVLSGMSLRTPSPVHNSPTSDTFPDGNYSPNQEGELLAAGCSDSLVPSSTPQQTQLWLHRHRFSSFSKLFCSFSGADLLMMTKEDLVQICGPGDGIRLFNGLKGRCVQPRLTIYVCQQQVKADVGVKAVDVYQAVYLEELTLAHLCEKMSVMLNVSPRQISHVYSQRSSGILVLVSDEMVQNFQEESSFIITTVRDETCDGLQVVLT